MTFAACSTDTTEDIAVLPDGTLRVSFSDDDSRVQLDENSRTVWNEGDQISVFNKTDGNECWRFDGKTGDTVGTISRVSGSAGGSAIGKIFAVYPYAESNAVSADGTITTEIPATQKYCADSYGVGNNIMVASSESGDLAFKNALGWIKIRLSGTETVKSLVLEGNDGETLTGTATIDADLTVSLAADAAKSLTLDCGEGVALSSDPTAFYFAVVPQVFEKGITVTAHYSDGSTFEKSTDKTITVERNHIVPMTKFDATVIPNNQIWYTSTDGKIVVPYATDGFGANIISNTYENGKGIITFDDEVKVIGNSAFFYCRSLTSITIPASVTAIEEYAFIGCNNITKVSIPDNITIIENCAFSNCSSLTSVTIPNSVTIIGVSAFSNCNSLTSITIPDSVTTFNGAFSGCSNLTAFYGKFTSGDNRCLIVGKELVDFAPAGLTEYVIYDNITTIGFRTFYNCTNLTNITLPNSITAINNNAFENCSNLTNIYCKSITPPSLGEYVFNKISLSAKIYVPKLFINVYKFAKGWSDYASMIVGYEYTDLPEPDYYVSTDYSADGTVQTLQKATIGMGIDIVLMGDAFSDRQIAAGDYDTAMRQAADNLFTEEPYKSFRDMFNVYAVTAVSATEGYEHDYTAFSGYFGDGTEVGGNDAKAFEYAQKAIAAERMDDALIVVMMNSQEYAGTCYMYYPSSNSDYGRGVSVAYFPLGTDNDMFAQLLHHEACGHGFAKLADEYAYEYMGAVSAETVAQHNQLTPYGWYKNTDFTSDPATVKWHTFLSDPRYANDGLGVFEGGATYWTGVWRPTENSIMRYNTGGFNAPSREAIYYRIHKLAYGESWNYDYEDFVAYDAVNRKASAGISFSTPIVPKDFVPLAPPVVVGKSWRDAR